MHRIITSLGKLSSLSILSQTTILQPMSGLKLRASKKSSSKVFSQLSQEYLSEHTQTGNSNSSNSKLAQLKLKGKLNTVPTSVDNSVKQQQELLEVQGAENSWLGNTLQDALLFETKEWESQLEGDQLDKIADKLEANTVVMKSNNSSLFRSPPQQQQQQAIQEQSQDNKPTSSNLIPTIHKHSTTSSLSQIKTKTFLTQLTKTQLIANSRKFLQIICNIFPRQQVQRILAEVKDFCSKRELSIPSSLISSNLGVQNEGVSAATRKSQQKKLQKQLKMVQKSTKDRQRKLFLGVRKVFDQCLTDLQLMDNLLGLLSQSDPYIMSSQDIHKMIYSHEQGAFQNQASHHKAQINLILDRKERHGLDRSKEQERVIDQLIQAKKDFLKESQQIMAKAINKRLTSLDQQSQEDLINVFEQFSLSLETQKSKKLKASKSKRESSARVPHDQVQSQPAQKQSKKPMKLIVKKNFNQQTNQKQAIPDQFQITQHSLHEIQRILFKNKKIVEDNVVFKKVKSKTATAKIQKEREEFGKNWIYGYEMPYALTHDNCQQFIDYLSKNYGDIIEYYIFPYKNMLEKRENIMIHIENQKRLKEEEWQKLNGPIIKEDKPTVADKLLQKIQKEKNLKLNKSSMVFKFRSYAAKQVFLLPQMRLYGINFQAFRNIRFEEAQSKKILALSMIPWGCSSQDLLRVINKALKPIDVQVSYQACILAKGFIFVQFDSFYESLNACRLLNNLHFQGHNLKVQINYGSSKIYGQKYKNALEFDHYQTLLKKLNDIKCFYNEVYQD